MSPPSNKPRHNVRVHVPTSTVRCRSVGHHPNSISQSLARPLPGCCPESSSSSSYQPICPTTGRHCTADGTRTADEIGIIRVEWMVVGGRAHKNKVSILGLACPALMNVRVGSRLASRTILSPDYIYYANLGKELIGRYG